MISSPVISRTRLGWNHTSADILESTCDDLWLNIEDLSFIGSSSSQYNNFSYMNGAVVNIPIHYDDSHELIVITPINLSGQIYGTYEMVLSMSQSYKAFDNQAKILL